MLSERHPARWPLFVKASGKRAAAVVGTSSSDLADVFETSGKREAAVVETGKGVAAVKDIPGEGKTAVILGRLFGA